MPTIKDVAARAGISSTTVSHTINGTRFVDPDTKERVWAAVRELGYRPNGLARSLRRRETRTIGLIIPDNANPFFADLARAIEDIGFEQEYSVILCNSDRSEAKEAAYVEMLLAKQIDGLFLVSTGGNEELLREILLAGVPVVLMPGDIQDAAIDMVMSEEESGGGSAASYLLALGHSKIGLITGPRDTSASAGRIAGFCRVLEDAGIVVAPGATVRGDFRPEGGRESMQQLLSRDLDLTAVFVANDAMAIGALSAIQTAGLRVPDDISVIGYDGIWLGAVASPPLTTVAASLSDVARVALSLLQDRMRDPSTLPRRVLVETRLVERESCRVVGPSITASSRATERRDAH